MNRWILVLFFHLAFHFLTSQDNGHKIDQDAIAKLSFQEIEGLEMDAYDQSDYDSLRTLCQIHIKKAKTLNDAIQKANAYYWLVVIEPDSLGLVYADSIISITKDADHIDYPTIGYKLKGEMYYDKGRYQESFNNFIQAYYYALKKDNLDDQRTISMNIAAIRNLNGQPYEAVDLYNRSLILLRKTPNYEREQYDDYLSLLYNLSLGHLRLSHLDSSKFYVRQGINSAILSKDQELYRDFTMVDAQINYYNHDLEPARDSLLKYVSYYEGNSRAVKLYYLAKIAMARNEPEKAERYFEQVDSIVSITNEPFTELKDVYHQLAMLTNAKQDARAQLGYVRKLIHFDSIISANQIEIRNQATIAYDIPLLKHEKSIAQAALLKKTKWNRILTVLGVLLGILGLFFYYRERKTARIVKGLIDNPTSLAPAIKQKKEEMEGVSEEIRNGIMEKLDVFEQSDRFLDANLDQTILANELATNTTYLSSVVNHYKGMSFPSYLKDLRIAYAVRELSINPELLKFNYLGLAERFGFKTAESFSKAFYVKTGVYPSNFLKELRSRKKDDL